MTEVYSLELTNDEAAYLDKQLEYLSRNAIHGLGDSIRAKLNYAPPKFPVGSLVYRQYPGPEGKGVQFKVIGHSLVSPSNWVAQLQMDGVLDPKNYFGVGEVFLREVDTLVST